MKERFFFSSHSLDHLADALFRELSADRASLFSPALIVIPPGGMKEWLQMELCQRAEHRAILGIEFVSWEIALAKLAGSLSTPTRASLLAAIWQALEKKKLDVAEHLASLFWDYTRSGFPAEIPEDAGWQKKLFDDIFQAHGWQTFPEALAKASHRDIGPLYLFGIDSLPKAVHRFFLQYGKLNVFRFSPTSMFWEDLRFSDGVQPLLANWGSMGRKMLADAAAFPSQEEENYDFDLGGGALDQLKMDFILLEKQEFKEECPSIECLQTGTSRLQEVEALFARIAALDIPFSDVRVYAPDIGAYAPLIEFCFNDQIPFRIKGVDFSQQSPFYQAIVRLFQCVEGRWEGDEILALFEKSSFYRKAGWQREEVKKFQEWIKQAGIRWGLDAKHRQETSEIEGELLEKGSWKTGFGALFDSWIFLQPGKEESLSWLDADLFESFYQRFEDLRKTLLSWKEERTLAQWADEIEGLVGRVLALDESSEADRAAARSFSQFIDLLRKLEFPVELFPFSLVETYFSTFSSGEEGGSLLHAVRFASLEPGAILPAKAIFLLGMDEESFPRSSAVSSIRLVKEEPSASERDRYLFLQAIFAAKDRLTFSYSHQSKKDGKAVSPTVLIQELFHYIGPRFKSVNPVLPIPRNGSFLTNTEKLPELGPIPETISIQDLTRFFKNPFQYYLKMQGISLKEEPESEWEDFEMSGLDRYLILKESLTGETNMRLPSGLFGEAAKVNVTQAIEEFKESLDSWGITSEAIHNLSFKEVSNPIEVVVQGKRISLVGEAGLTVPSGVLHMGRDEVGAYLRKWPEMLAALIANQSHRIYCLKTGRVREVADPKGALERAVELYLRCQNTPFFLHPEWADDLLRKDRIPEDCEDRVVEWALKRSSDYSLEKEREIWKETLAQVFAPLTTLFERGSNATV